MVSEAEKEESRSHPVMLFEEDYAAADRFFNRIPEQYRDHFEAARQQLAKLHSTVGPRLFAVRFESVAPRSESERLLCEFMSLNLRADQPVERKIADFYEASVSIQFLSNLLVATEHRLDHYDDFWRLIYLRSEIYDQESEGWLVDQKAGYHVREMCRRPVDIFADEVQQEKLLDNLLALRYEAGRNICSIGNYTANSAYVLFNLIVDHINKMWKYCTDRSQKLAADSPVMAVTPATKFYRNKFSDLLPVPQALDTLLQDEILVIKSLLKSQTVAHTCIPQEEPLSKSASDNRETRRVRAKSSLSKTHEIRYQDWAVGIELPGRWWLFRRYGAEWRQKSLVIIPGGHAQQIMELLAKGGGAMSRDEALSMLQGPNSSQRLERNSSAITHGLAKAKLAIRKAIADSTKLGVGNFRNPIPHVEPGWRALVEIGYAVADDRGKLHFCHHDDLGLRL